MIKRRTTSKQIENYIEEQLELREKVLINTLAYIGEQCVNHARTVELPKGFRDQTGNLRSSIGYIIVKDGKTIQWSDFKQVKDGSEGSDSGKRFAESLAKKYRKGIALIVVAGMNYAYYVESYHNRDVLTSSELLAKKELERMKKELFK